MSAIPEGVTLGLAITGVVLGVMNTWRAFDRDRVRLKVIPKLFITSDGTSGLCVEVVNVGYIPVTLHQVWIKLRVASDRNQFMWIPKLASGAGWPARLEPRTAVTILMPPGADKDPVLGSAKFVAVQTACGRTFRGSSAAFRGHVAKLSAAG